MTARQPIASAPYNHPSYAIGTDDAASRDARVIRGLRNGLLDAVRTWRRADSRDERLAAAATIHSLIGTLATWGVRIDTSRYHPILLADLAEID